MQRKQQRGVTQMDWLRVNNIQQFCIIGLFPHERIEPQELQLDIELGLDLSSAGKTNRLDETIDYAQVLRFVRWLLATARFELIEHAAETIAYGLLSLRLPSLVPYDAVDPRRPRLIRLRLRKPKALQWNACPEIEIERDQTQILKHQQLWLANQKGSDLEQTGQAVFLSSHLELISHRLAPSETLTLPSKQDKRERFLLAGQRDLIVSGQYLARKQGLQLDSQVAPIIEHPAQLSQKNRYFIELAYQFSSDQSPP